MNANERNSCRGRCLPAEWGAGPVFIDCDRFGWWTLPKGKREAGETEEETALREIEEETGIKGEIITFLQKTAYTYTHPEKGLIAKEVHYFLVKAVGGESKPQLTEITGVDWFSAEKAWKLQQEKGYENNREVLIQAFQALKVKKIDEKGIFNATK